MIKPINVKDSIIKSKFAQRIMKDFVTVSSKRDMGYPLNEVENLTVAAMNRIYNNDEKGLKTIEHLMGELAAKS